MISSASSRRAACAIAVASLIGLTSSATGQVPLHPIETLHARAIESVSKAPEDRYTVTLSITREGTSRHRSEYLPNGRFRASGAKWRHGPTTVSLELIGERPGGDTHGIMVELASWLASLQQWSAEVESRSAFQNPDAIDRAYASAGDAEVILRVLQGLLMYGGQYNTDNLSMEFAGGYSEHTGSSWQAPEPVVVKSVQEDEWSLDAPPTDRSPRSPYSTGAIHLIVWRFRGVDMARIDELATNVEAIRTSMTLHPLNAGDRIAALEAERFHALVRDPLIKGIILVSRLAWWWGREEPPNSRWAKSVSEIDPAFHDRLPSDFDPVDGPGLRGRAPWPARTANQGLPPLASETIMVLTIPHLGIYPGEAPGERTIPSYRSWSVPRESFVYRVGSPERERHEAGPCVFNAVLWCSTIRAAPSEPVFEGHFTAVTESSSSERRRAEGVDGEYLEESEVFERHRVEWRVEGGGELPRPVSPGVSLRIVKLVGGSYERFDGPLAFGVPFFVEAELEPDDARRAMDVTIDDGTGERTVALRATDENPRILRSRMLYLIWDDSPDVVP